MSLSRRGFLASSSACLVGGFAATAEGATASRSRLFVSDWPLRLIGRELILGVGYSLLSSKKLADIVAGIGAGRLETKLQTFRESINVDLEGLTVTHDGELIAERVQYYLGALKVIAEQTAASPTEVPEELDQFVDKALLEGVKAAVEQATLEYAYRIRYQRVYVSTNTTLRKGHVRKVVKLLCPVGQVQGLQFVSDVQERCGQTHLTSSLWIDYCVGRREGPIVRRIAEREIGCREDVMLSRLERVVYEIVHKERNVEDLRKVVPDLIRRIETQEIG